LSSDDTQDEIIQASEQDSTPLGPLSAEDRDSEPDASILDRIGGEETSEVAEEELPDASILDGIGGAEEDEPEEAPAPTLATLDAIQEAPAEVDESTAEESDEEAEEEAEPEPFLTPDPDDGVRRRWYALHSHSGQEANVKRSLLAQAEQQGLSDQITQILIPMEEVAEIKSGEKKISQRKFFPGYVLVRLPEHPERQADLWHLIKETSGITGFIGSRTAPVPLEDEEITAIAEEVRGERERPRPKVKFDEGERVKIIDGPFANFFGNIDEINAERGTMKVMVVIFERLTSVEIEFWQAEKA
jgi:transcriptional antiterminator NusG